MNLKRTPNAWTCIATAFAMCLDMEVRDIFDILGHDGGEILFEHLPEPRCRRGHHVQELIDIAISRGFAVTEIEALPASRYGPGDEHCYLSSAQAEARIQRYLDGHSGVLTGQAPNNTYHAVAWDHDSKIILDPVGLRYRLDQSAMVFDAFWVVQEIKSPPKNNLTTGARVV